MKLIKSLMAFIAAFALAVVFTFAVTETSAKSSPGETAVCVAQPFVQPEGFRTIKPNVTTYQFRESESRNSAKNQYIKISAPVSKQHFKPPNYDNRE